MQTILYIIFGTVMVMFIDYAIAERFYMPFVIFILFQIWFKLDKLG